MKRDPWLLADADEVPLDEELTPYIRLAAACLRQKLGDYARIALGHEPFPKLDDDELEVYDATQDWFWDESEAPFSLHWLCAHLGYDPEFVRSATLTNLERVAAPGRWAPL